MSEHNVETQLLRLSVAVGVNVLAARYIAGLTGWNKDFGTAAAIGAMLYRSQAKPAELGAAPASNSLLDRAAELLTKPGSIVVEVLASTAPQLTEATK